MITITQEEYEKIASLLDQEIYRSNLFLYRRRGLDYPPSIRRGLFADKDGYKLLCSEIREILDKGEAIYFGGENQNVAIIDD